MGKRPQFKERADLLEHLVKEIAQSRLPSTRRIARFLDVSPTTALKLVQELKLRGVVTSTNRSRAKLTSSQPIGHENKLDSAAMRFSAILVEGIKAGFYRAGTALPKIDYFARVHRFSRTTVHKALICLIEQKLLHRRGKQYIVGPEREPNARSGLIPGTFITVLCKDHHIWFRLRQGSFAHFCQSFANEAAINNVHLSCEEFGVQNLPFETIAQGVLARIRASEPRYLGTLMVGKREQFPDFEQWVKLLEPLRRPIVWFDHAAQGLGDHKRPSSLLSCCTYSNETVAKRAIEFLTNAGHCRAAYIASKDESWQMERFRLLRDLGRAHRPQLAISCHQRISSEDCRDPVSAGLPDRLSRIRSSCGQGVNAALTLLETHNRDIADLLGDFVPDSMRAHPLAGFFALPFAPESQLRRLQPELRTANRKIWAALNLAECLRDGSDPTALIAPNDYLARGLHTRWCRDLGIEISRDLSIIAFDNIELDINSSLTTVDFGLNAVGYQAFHTFMGDVPTTRGRSGIILSQPFVVQKGSVSGPGPGLSRMLASTHE